jgi:hypothetical protein
VEDVDTKLWELEKEFWLGGADVYRRHLADDAVMLFPGMVLAKSQTVESMAAGSRWTSVNFSDQRLVRLTSEVVCPDLSRVRLTRARAVGVFSPGE